MSGRLFWGAVTALMLSCVSLDQVNAQETATHSLGKPAYLTGGRVAKPKVVAIVPSIDYGQVIRIMDPHAPQGDREDAFAQLRAQADAGNTAAQYFVGTLYRAGDDVNGSPVPRDMAKARLYLSNAAIHGHLLAMAKMSEMSLDAGELQAAMDWAQIFTYYAPRTRNLTQFRSYVVELVSRVSTKMGHDLRDKETLSDLNDFIAAHDADVSAGLAVNRQPRILPGDRTLRVDTRFALPKAGFADYIIAVRPDGTVDRVWALDGTPRFSLAYSLKSKVEELKTPSINAAGLTYAWFAEALDDHLECMTCNNMPRIR